MADQVITMEPELNLCIFVECCWRVLCCIIFPLLSI